MPLCPLCESREGFLFANTLKREVNELASEQIVKQKQELVDSLSEKLKNAVAGVVVD